MTVENARTAVIIGTCCYSDELLEDVRKTKTACTLYSWNPYVDGRIHVNPFRMDACVDTLLRHGVTRVLHAGAVSVDDFSALLNNAGKEDDDNIRYQNEAYLRRPAEFYGAYTKRLTEAGIEIIPPWKLFDWYRPPATIFGYEDDESRFLASVAEGLVLETQAACFRVIQAEGASTDTTRIGYIPRSMVYEIAGEPPDITPLAIERTGSRDMLRALPPKSRPSWRLLLKVCPAGFPRYLDCPTISPETIEAARDAYIDLIAIDINHGLIINPQATVAAAIEAGIVLYGFSRD